MALQTLAEYGATPVSRRVVEQGKIITSAGVSAGIDMALWLTGQMHGPAVARAVQRAMEYDPAPPYAAEV
jgi:transcriptional regulator GlxA family with amidase domain